VDTFESWRENNQVTLTEAEYIFLLQTQKNDKECASDEYWHLQQRSLAAGPSSTTATATTTADTQFMIPELRYHQLMLRRLF
jgi:hypothetical protein